MHLPTSGWDVNWRKWKWGTEKILKPSCKCWINPDPETLRRGLMTKHGLWALTSQFFHSYPPPPPQDPLQEPQASALCLPSLTTSKAHLPTHKIYMGSSSAIQEEEDDFLSWLEDKVVSAIPCKVGWEDPNPVRRVICWKVALSVSTKWPRKHLKSSWAWSTCWRNMMPLTWLLTM